MSKGYAVNNKGVVLTLKEDLEFFRKLCRALIKAGNIAKPVNSVNDYAAVRIGCKNLSEGVCFGLEHFRHAVKADKTCNG